jgi:hypothetical protein
MSTIKHQPNCQKCGRNGQIYEPRDCKKKLPLECPVCTVENKAHRLSPVRWQSLAGICPECTGYNGYPGDGLCKSCYENKYGADNE